MASDNGNGTDSEQGPQPPRQRQLRIPAQRAFLVKKYNGDRTELIEQVVQSHLVEMLNEGHVQFMDIELEADGTPVTRLHKLIYNVEEVTDLDRPIPKSTLIAH